MAEEEFLVAIWFVAGDEKDWMGMVYQAPGEDKWRIRYRFRYYSPQPSDPFAGKDKKSWWNAEPRSEMTLAEIREIMTGMAGMISSIWGADINDCFEVNDLTSAIATKPNRPPWMHLRMAPQG